jgi:flagellar protein FliO/FliZ
LADPVAGTAAPTAVQGTPPELWGTLLQSFGMLLLVLALLILVLWVLRRYFSYSGAIGQQGIIRIITSLHVAPKERIALVDVLGEKLLIGITAQQISFLARIEDEKDICNSEELAKSRGGLFKALLKRKLGETGNEPNMKKDER